MMLNTLWALGWRLSLVLSYPFLLVMRNANAVDLVVVKKVDNIDVMKEFAIANPTALIIAACILCWLSGAVVGALYPMPDDMKAVEINPWLRFFICLVGGFAAFLWVLNSEGALTLLTPLWVGGVALVAPHLIQIVPTVIKARLGLGGKL